MADIIIVRHGSTAWNEKERFRGLADIELSELGRKQAIATAKRLEQIGINAIYTSPVRRALETATYISQPHNLKPLELSEVSDIDYGEFQGLSFTDAEKKYETIYRKWLEDPDKVKFPGGESLQEVKDRASSAVEKIINGLNNDTVVIVSHKVVINMLIVYFLGLKNYQFRQVAQDPCAINIFQKQKNNVYAILLNDTCHLDKINKP